MPHVRGEKSPDSVSRTPIHRLSLQGAQGRRSGQIVMQLRVTAFHLAFTGVYHGLQTCREGGHTPGRRRERGLA